MPPPAASNAQPTSHPAKPNVWPILASCIFLPLLSCTPEKQNTPTAAPLLPAEITLASAHLEANRPDLALAILAADPTHPETRQLLDQTIWHLPAAHIEHPGCDVHHIAIHGQSLWVALTHPPFHTIVRWNLDALELEAVLFPVRDPLRVFVLSPSASHAVITRGEVSLLIDAHTLKPIADLGTIPTGITPESAITFSADSLLLAHPADAAWHIRDTTTGQIIRTIVADEIPGSPVLAAHLDTQRLRLLTANGTHVDIPVSPVEPITIPPFTDEPIDIRHAHFIDPGHTAIVAMQTSPHSKPDLMEWMLEETPDSTEIDIDAWALLQSQSTLPSLHSGLLSHLKPPAITFSGTSIVFHGTSRPPILPSGARTLVAYATDPTSSTLAAADSDGHVILYRTTQPPDHPSHDSLTALAQHHYNRDTSTYYFIAPELEIKSDLTPLNQRLTDATELPAASPAHRLAEALTKDDPSPIATILESPENLPPTLRTLAISHIHHRQGNTAAAFAPYHNGFPNIAAIRLREDWHGWEQPDFQPAVTALENAYQSIIATLTIDPEAEETTRLETIARLTSSAALETLGRKRYATACLDAAKALTLIAGEAEHAFTLATLARHHGAPVVPCLRTEALALTALEKFAEAHTRWIALITDHPAADHLPDDYAEAAYTAFENANPRQALEILITGMHRFGDQPSFALRSGWIALLTGHPDHARAFLLKGLDAGFPEDELEHATALLATSAALINDAASAASHFQDLITLDPAWASPDTIDALPWPDHLKAPLRQLTW
jgi:hypothetical protein